jgi:hypothetical protein
MPKACLCHPPDQSGLPWKKSQGSLQVVTIRKIAHETHENQGRNGIAASSNRDANDLPPIPKEDIIEIVQPEEQTTEDILLSEKHLQFGSCRT